VSCTECRLRVLGDLGTKFLSIHDRLRTATWIVLPDAAPDVRQRMASAITAWALDLSAGHPTDHGTIVQFLNDCDFLVIITKAIDGKILCQVHATSNFGVAIT